MKQYLYRALVAAVVICAVTQAAEASPGDQPAEETRENGTTHALEEIIITASRQESKVFNSSLPVNVVTREAIEKIAPTGMGDLFEHLPGLNVSHTSMGSVRPMIRGLYDERVLVMVDGIRLSEQRGGGDHALSINPGQIERIEVVRGPAGSVLYGSDAIGALSPSSRAAVGTSGGTRPVSARSWGRSTTAPRTREPATHTSRAGRATSIFSPAEFIRIPTMSALPTGS
jgi:outer membrane receptor for ferrienterochelin and colicin